MGSIPVEAPLDYAVFQLSPCRSRCELVVAVDGREETLTSGSTEPWSTHLTSLDDRINRGDTMVKLEGQGQCWFTKGTFERFMRFANEPELLERPCSIEGELSEDVSEAAGVYSDEDKMEKGETGTSKQTLLENEQKMAFSRAMDAGFTINSLPSLRSFASCFGGLRLRDACDNYVALHEKKFGRAESEGTNVVGVTIENSNGVDITDRRLSVQEKIIMFEKSMGAGNDDVRRCTDFSEKSTSEKPVLRRWSSAYDHFRDLRSSKRDAEVGCIIEDDSKVDEAMIQGGDGFGEVEVTTVDRQETMVNGGLDVQLTFVDRNETVIDAELAMVDGDALYRMIDNGTVDPQESANDGSGTADAESATAHSQVDGNREIGLTRVGRKGTMVDGGNGSQETVVDGGNGTRETVVDGGAGVDDVEVTMVNVDDQVKGLEGSESPRRVLMEKLSPLKVSEGADDDQRSVVSETQSLIDRKGRLYDKYRQTRDARLRDEASKVERQAKLKSMQETLERRRAEITKSARKSSPFVEAQIRAAKLRAFKAEMLELKRQKDEEDRKRLEALRLQRQKRMSSTSSPSSPHSPVTAAFKPGSKGLLPTFQRSSGNSRGTFAKVPTTNQRFGTAVTQSVPSMGEFRKVSAKVSVQDTAAAAKLSNKALRKSVSSLNEAKSGPLKLSKHLMVSDHEEGASRSSRASVKLPTSSTLWDDKSDSASASSSGIRARITEDDDVFLDQED